MHARCSPASRALRYHGGRRGLSPTEWHGLVDPARGTTFVAQERRDGPVVAVAHLMALGDPATAELAVLVEDAWQRKGLGTRLVGHLLAHARARGIRRVLAEVQSHNRPMLKIAHHYGAPTPHPAQVLTLTFPTTG
jgi:GNAT superfamily N-acetyltransferase